MFALSREPASSQVVLWRNYEESELLPLGSREDLHVGDRWYDGEAIRWVTDSIPSDIAFLISDPSAAAGLDEGVFRVFGDQNLKDSVAISYNRIHPEKSVGIFKTEMQWLHLFCILPGYHPVVKILLVNGADPNSIDSHFKWTPLSWTTTSRTAKVLIETKAKVNARNERGETPLYVATMNDRHSVVEVLLSNHADPKATTSSQQRSPLHEARSGETAGLLIQKGAVVDCRDKWGRTPLHDAVTAGREDVVRILLANNASLHIADEGGETPLQKVKSENITQLVLQHVPDLNQQNEEGNTLLHLWCQDGNEEAVKCLLKQGVDNDIQNKKGETALDIARAKGALHIAALFPEQLWSASTSTGRFKQEFQILKDEKHKDGFLGKGSFGRVYKAREQRTNRVYAVKCIPFKDSPQNIANVLQEVRAAVELSKKSGIVVEYHDAWIEENESDDNDDSEFSEDEDDSSSTTEGEPDENETSNSAVSEEKQEELNNITSQERNQQLKNMRNGLKRSCNSDDRDGTDSKEDSDSNGGYEYNLYLQMELMDFSLQEFIRMRNQNYFKTNHRQLMSEDRRTAIRIFRDLCRAVDRFHKYGIHRDFKPENILISELEPEGGDTSKRYAVKLGDLGLAVKHHDRWSTANVGTPLYAAPEQWVTEARQTKYGSEADIYPLGLILIELLLPMEENERDDLFLENLHMKEVTIPEEIQYILDKEHLDLLERTLSHDPTQRPSADDLWYYFEEVSSAQKR
ncbi:unnamed protein product [Cyprideis torosa]|uniref:non-specific serine/threonine protein kinase n=1 Tax=Cyprideis torosa TaxID=163714 RepID=A0A7R8ZSQ4_9CRUS|nr:unnamed protein product [Cyprideis torosa]CAG0896064.1 unnamed protein product [Cyprideis torosa]